MAKCTGVRCPMQYGYKVEECNHTDCPYRTEPITNADRIRAMSDEELAESLSKTVVDAMCYSHSAKKSVDKMPKEIWEDLVKEYLEWLKQPAEEGDGNEKRRDET